MSGVPEESATVVAHCSKAACGDSRAVAKRLEHLGYSDVRTYRDGTQDWAEAGLLMQATPAAADDRART